MRTPMTTNKHDADFAWAVIGPGRIAHRFAEAVTALPGMHLHAVHGRDAVRAADFARRWPAHQDEQAGKHAQAPVHGHAHVHAEVDNLLADPRIDAVYIATPHALHGDFIRRCLLAGKPVLCEKPLVPTQAQASALVALSRNKGVFLMEGLWTRLLPVYAGVRRWLDEGAIGKVNAIQSSFCFAAPYDPRSRLFDAQLAGGSLLDIGLYNLAMTRWVLEPRPGACPEPVEMQVSGVLAPSGVDQRVAATLRFADGAVSQFLCGFDSVADNTLHIVGERGAITLPECFWQATRAVLSRPGKPPVTLQAPMRINGFEAQIEEVVRCVRAGRVESEHMPHAETLALLGWMDTLRARLGVRYPFE
jgi:predicted dehydrogenase